MKEEFRAMARRVAQQLEMARGAFKWQFLKEPPPGLKLAPPRLPCVPPFWAQGCHLQTIAAQFLPYPDPELPWEHHRLELGDGDAMALQSLEGTSGVVIHLFHGMSGSTGGHYMRRAAARLHAQGHAVLAVNHRGAGEGKGWSRDFYHGGSTGDMAAALAYGRQRFPNHVHVAIGFSISANILLLLLGRDGLKDLPDRAIAVNPPVDLEACSQRMQLGFNRAYDQYFLSCIRAEVEARCGATPLLPSASMRAFDESYTAAMAGFPDRATYYAKCSCGPHLKDIKVPTVIITSEDDPFAPAADILKQPRSPSVHLHVEKFGGHMGYVTENLEDRRWLDYALDHYVAELLP
jgi:predicted alpha/beta-fold hydrolase